MARITVDDCLKTDPQPLRADAGRHLPRAPAHPRAPPRLIDGAPGQAHRHRAARDRGRQGRHRNPEQGSGLSVCQPCRDANAPLPCQVATGSTDTCRPIADSQAPAMSEAELLLRDASSYLKPEDVHVNCAPPTSSPRPRTTASSAIRRTLHLPSARGRQHSDAVAPRCPGPHRRPAARRDGRHHHHQGRDSPSSSASRWPNWWTASPSSTRSSSRPRKRRRPKTSARCCWPWRAMCASS